MGAPARILQAVWAPGRQLGAELPSQVAQVVHIRLRILQELLGQRPAAESYCTNSPVLWQGIPSGDPVAMGCTVLHCAPACIIFDFQ